MKQPAGGPSHEREIISGNQTVPAKAGGGRSHGHLSLFFVLAFAITWSLSGIYWLFAANQEGSPNFALRAASYLAVWGPSLAGLAVVWIEGGRSAAGRLVSRLWQYAGSLKWYAIALLLPIIIYVIAGGAGAAFSAYPFSRLYSFDATRLLVFALATIPSGPLGEEFGWRGYALPRLAAIMHPLAAALLIGVAWSLWHLPAFVVPGLQELIFPTGLTFWELLGVTMSGAVIVAWLTFRGNFALGPAVVFHFTLLTMLLGVHQTPPPTLTGTTIALYAVLAIALIAINPRLGCPTAAEKANCPHAEFADRVQEEGMF